STGLGASFDYKSYLAKSDIYSVISYPEIKVVASGQGSKLKQSLFWLKQRFEGAIEKILPEPQAAFLAGLTLGEKKELSQELTEAFKKTGTTHIVALSGYNISIIAGFFMTIFGWFMLRRSLRFWLAVVAIIFFTVLTGASASVVRAAIMGILVLVARQEGRMYNVRNALAFAGAVMIFINPKILRFDIGFQLSFGATMGLVWLAPVFEKWFVKLPRALGLKEILIATLSAQLAVLPLLLVYFGQLSIVSPAANLVVLVFVPWAMLIGFLAGSAAMIWLALGKIFGWLAWLILTFEIKAIEFFASLPLASVKISWGWLSVTIYYLVLVAFLYRFFAKQKSRILVESYASDSQ
ncbi:MAG: ComEC/Rec2 family competence protein, partial [bacterium]